MREIAEALTQAMGVQTRIAFNGQLREGDPRSLVADVSKAEALGFAPQVPLQAGLERLAAWIRAIRA